jgi:hypothetical protein
VCWSLLLMLLVQLLVRRQVQVHRRSECVLPQQAAWQVSQKQVGVPSSG